MSLHLPGLGLFRTSVRAKLLSLVLAPLILGIPIFAGLVWLWSTSSYHRLLTFKVGSDLVIAREYFGHVQKGVGAGLEGLARDYRFRRALERPQGLARELEVARQRLGLDFLRVLDARGRPLSGQPGSEARWPVLVRALEGQGGSVLDVYDSTALAELDPALARRAVLPILPTPQATPDERQAETRGLMLHAAMPILGAQGQVQGVLEAGVLLNGNLDMVDSLNAIIYRQGSLPQGSQGTVTLFLGDVRIATNVRLFGEERALGTRVSRQVREQVLERGETWLDRAFVVNDWYVSAYEPLVDSQGRRVGMLYVGFLEAPFSVAQQQALLAILGLFVVVSLVGCAWSLSWAREVFQPIERINRVIARIHGGEPQARVGETGSRDELGRLAAEFDSLLDLLEEKRTELERWADALDRKVQARTAALESAHAELLEARRQLETSKKLAALGQLTAGTAHEINNPVAVIQGNLDLLREILGAQAAPVDVEIRLINQQIHRIRVIITKLLQFAHPEEFAGSFDGETPWADPAEVIADCLVLTRHHLEQSDVRVEQALGSGRRVRINPLELQQILVNLVVNALQAMPAGGTLRLSSADWDEQGQAMGVQVKVADSGCGILPEHLDRVFDPFFTTKKNEGTGLGLSISYSLVQRHGGRITVSSRPGEGSEFTLWLRAAQ